uniref:Histone H1 n=1 Tax=Strongyloides venezuelensis TaxID=75913 RepID=A0A0K0F1X6_STRVS
MVSFFTKTLLATIFFVFTTSYTVAEKAFDSALSSALENNKNGEHNLQIGANNLFGGAKKKPEPKKPAPKKPAPKKPVTKKPAAKKATKKEKATKKKAGTTEAATTEVPATTDASV